MDPMMISFNSEVFLFKCGVIPLWESMPDGANIDVNFKDGTNVVPFWQKMVSDFFKLWIWNNFLGLQGFSFVKRHNGSYRFTLWTDTHFSNIDLGKVFGKYKYSYRKNSQRMMRHDYLPTFTQQTPHLQLLQSQPKAEAEDYDDLHDDINE
eukprot:TRINITY_DN8664_c1_g1_i1.p1 TRINITY_DN8664_c1_g1~~TRINITY_DN8664_c1_g1_i1.p1  ORF type:complete len:151 (-),score=28.54 TRINITY_DN8664_c1_g1_i1:97-549(-)